MDERLKDKGPNGLIERRTSLFLFAMAGVVFIVFLVGIEAVSSIKKVIVSERSSAMETVLNTTLLSLNEWRDDRIDDMGWLFRDAELMGLIGRHKAFLDKGAHPSDSPYLEKLCRKLYESFFAHDRIGIHIISRDMVVVASSDSKLSGLKIEGYEYTEMLDRAFAGESLMIPTSVFLNEKASLLVAAPLTPHMKEKGDIIVIEIDPMKSLTRILEMARFGASGESYAFDRKGRMISESRFADQLAAAGLMASGESSVLNLRVADPGTDLTAGGKSYFPRESQPLTLMARSAVSGQGGNNVEGYRDYRGVMVVGAWLWDEKLGFGIATEQDRVEAYEAYERARLIIWQVLAVTAALFASLAAMQFAARRRLNFYAEKISSANKSLSHSQFMLKEAQAIVMMGHWELDIVKDRLYWSEEIYNLFEIDPDQFEASYDAFLNAIHPDDREMVSRAYRESLEDRAPYEICHRLRMKGGRVKYVREKCRTDFGGDGKPLYSIGTIQDITEQKLVEERLNSYARKIERSNRDLEEFAYVASHDLQEPLRKIESFSERIRNNAYDCLGERERDYFDRMQSAASRMRVLITDLLSLSRVTTRCKPFEETDLNMVLKDVESDLEVKLRETGARIEKGGLPIIDADYSQMRQLMQNLIGNALKFSKKDVQPVIRIWALVDTRIKQALDGAVRIVVEDNGIGFEEKYADKIFNAFQRLHGRSEYEGSGIGLSVCRKIVERHHGRIETESELGEGAKFIVILPKKQKEGGVEDEGR